jgi:hypothetical protein
MDLAGDIRQNGQPVQVGPYELWPPLKSQIYDCNGTPAQNWVLNKGETKVVLANTNFCLDATQGFPPDGTKMKIWECYTGLPQQDWYYTGDNRVALTNQGMCLDLTDGVLTNGNRLQVWQCTDGNTNQ